MEQIEELKKKLQCENCHKPYSESDEVWIHVKCKHHACDSCFHAALYHKCAVCSCSTDYHRYSLMEEMLNTLKNYENSIVKSGEVETALRDEIAKLKQEKVLLETPLDHHKCIECDKLYSDQEMQLCKTCHELKFVDHEDVKKNALCPACAIKKHMRQGHHTVDFFPYFSAYNFSSQSSKIHSNSAEFKSARDLFNETFTRFNASSINISGNYNVLTDMARRSKNTKVQVEFFEKMQKFIDKSKSIHVEADSDMKNHTTKLEETLVEIKEWYESRIEDCVDESEIIKLSNLEESDKMDTEIDG